MLYVESFNYYVGILRFSKTKRRPQLLKNTT
jgi:hypothetical protein